jgi:hypothetical protein
MTVILRSIGILALCSMFTGCTMMAIQTERQLSASGFQMKLADTEAKANHLASLKQRKLFPTKKDGKLVYVYADAKACQCLYVGSESDYQRYQQMVVTQREIDEQRETAEEMDDASMEWDSWGPWYRPVY